MTGITDANCMFGLWPRGDLNASLPTVLRLLGKAGIGGAAMGALRAALFDAETGNAEALAACEGQRGLLPVAGLCLREAVGIHDRVAAIRREGFVVLRLFREYEGWPVDYAPLEQALQAAAYWGLPVMVAALLPGDLTALGRVVARTSCPVIVTGVNISHTPLVAEAIAVGRDCPFMHFETSRLEGVGTLELVARGVGVARLIFGTGLPFQYPSSALALVRESGLGEDEIAAVLGGNLARLIASAP